jgi:RNA polymerase sigma-70 factor (sigma-E family)
MWRGSTRTGTARSGTSSDEEFDAAFRSLFVQAYRVARRIVGDAASAEDIAAEALSRAYANWGRISGLQYRDAWVLRVTTNLALNSIRPRRAVPVERPAGSADDDATATRLALVDALRALPQRQREVIVMRHLAGYSESEIAERLGISVGSVKTHMRRAKTSLRDTLSVDYLGNES